MKLMDCLHKDFRHHSLEQQDQAALMDRCELKYLLPVSQLATLLPAWAGTYSSLSHNGYLLHDYNSLYLDAPDARFYLQHHNGKRERHKLRWRHYQSSDEVYFELKKRLRSQHTVKQRVRVPQLGRWNTECADLLSDHPALQLTNWQPVLQVKYQRFTLLNRAATERITVDINLSYTDVRHGSEAQALILKPWAIVEIKTPQKPLTSWLARQLRESGIRPRALSKFALGRALLDRTLKQNAFKPLIHDVWRLPLTRAWERASQEVRYAS